MRGSRPAVALAVAALAAALLAGPPSTAQDRLSVPSPVLTVDQDALFERSAFGERVLSEIEAASQALAAENRRLEAELAEEERRLTELRPTTEPAAFREMAAAFDARVVEVRRVQDQKGRELARQPEEARQEFLRAAVPILTRIVRERGAVAILDSRAVILSADAIDITDEAIRRIDAVLGEAADPDGGAEAGPSAPGPAGDAPPPDEGGAGTAPEAPADPLPPATPGDGAGTPP